MFLFLIALLLPTDGSPLRLSLSMKECFFLLLYSMMFYNCAPARKISCACAPRRGRRCAKACA